MKSAARIILFSFILLTRDCFAQNNPSFEKRVHYTISVKPTAGFVFAHDEQVSNTAGTYITGFEIKLNRKRLDEKARQYRSKLFNSGFSFAYARFSKEFLGNGIYGAYFIQPYFINNENVTFGPIAKVGLSLNSNPYHEQLNNENFSYSSYVNPYLSLGLNAALRISKKINLEGGVYFNHTSNGGIKHPNYGMNYPGASLGLEYDLGIYKTTKITLPPDFKWRFDVTPFASYKSIALDRKHFYWVYGAGVQAGRKVGRLHAFTLGAEWLTDLGKKKEFEIAGHAGADHKRLGALVGHEFVFNKVHFSQQLGVFIYNQDPNAGRFYHRWGLYYQVGPDWMIGAGLTAHRLTADFLDLKLRYSFYK